MNKRTEREVFMAWSNQRAQRLQAEASSIAAKAIEEGASDTVGAYRAAILTVLAREDETGWDAWQARAALVVGKDTKTLVVGITDDEIDDVWDCLPGSTSYMVNTTDQRRFARAVLALQKAKESKTHVAALAADTESNSKRG